MNDRPGEDREGPLEKKDGDAEEEVDDLQGRDRLDGRVERLGEKVPEDLGPEEALDGSADLV